jgi:hypothetical protein
VSRRLVLSAADARMAELLEVGREPRERYARTHGYHIRTLTWPVVLGRREARWGKLGALRRALLDHDVVVWLDADTVICRFDRDIADDVPDDCFQGLVLEHCGDRFNPNTGVWVMRRDPRSLALLDQLGDAGPPHHSWSDQAAVCVALGWDLGDFHGHGAKPVHGSAFLAGTAWLPPEWNPTGLAEHCVQPRIRHFAGRDLAQRLEAMRTTVMADCQDGDA